MTATMGQMQPTRFPMNGPSWDEEVVPALRKRLESESRTLAKRMSAVSLSSQDHDMLPDTPASPFLQSNASIARSQYHHDHRAPADRILPRQNGTPKIKPPSPAPAPAVFHRSRTYSQPYLADLPNGRTPRPKTNASVATKSPRVPQDPRPTRIPQPASRSPPSIALSGSGSSASTTQPTPIPNGHHQYTTTQDSHNGNTSEISPRTPTAISRGVPNNVNVGLGLLNEPPPFNPASPSRYYPDPQDDPPRPSMESEERPFEHWYRGEVSRNGGVGELRVGRRQEMLEIANYGHTIRALERERREEDGRRRRKRADSVSGIGGVGRDRGSLYLDEEDARDIGLVLDEAPLTDLEGSEEGGHYEGTYGAYGYDDEDEDRFEQEQRDVSTSPPPLQRPSNETRSTTPTPSIRQQPQQRPSSRNTSAPPSRIPARSRQSSESRVTTPTPVQMMRGTSEPPATHAPSTSNAAPSPPPTRQRQQSRPTQVGKTPAKTRTAAAKARAKTLASRKEMEEEMKRRSVAYYPTPGGEGDETMIDAIPEWTQPVPRQGNWDEVVLPVVARKKGLDEHYEKADGNPAPKKAESTVAPAPGTFGFDHSKYRPPRIDGDPELIPMDEFGRPTPQAPPAPVSDDDEPSANSPYPHPPTSHDQTRLPVRTVPSPAPFSDYAPMRVEKSALGMGDIEQARLQSEQRQEEKDEGGGCCKCVIM
ncbi:hypothetical protein D9615_003050 [Tricholomella constricta]|uniref:Uncharacterized protein n=1 Tax=Tricholomella constricta TaxID=117010 RepID=A0A8H5M6P2_9AGAR|nr:hypothetical protein D9615_003050 [Tricholomella constricta]